VKSSFSRLDWPSRRLSSGLGVADGVGRAVAVGNGVVVAITVFAAARGDGVNICAESVLVGKPGIRVGVGSSVAVGLAEAGRVDPSSVHEAAKNSQAIAIRNSMAGRSRTKKYSFTVSRRIRTYYDVHFRNLEMAEHTHVHYSELSALLLSWLPSNSQER
jgi:hypothetical protein